MQAKKAKLEELLQPEKHDPNKNLKIAEELGLFKRTLEVQQKYRTQML